VNSRNAAGPLAFQVRYASSTSWMVGLGSAIAFEAHDKCQLEAALLPA
jgi:hypothetical protein